MGYGQYSGNMSVHWSVTHEDEKGEALKLAAQTGRSAHPTKAHDVNVDNGVRGRDPVSPPDVGKRKGHSGHFRVRLRFERMKDAREAAAAAQSVMFEDGMYVLVLDVPVIARAAADDPPPCEVRVDW
jgi:hypothetical protein